MGLRTANDSIPEGERVFMMASDMKAMEEGDILVKVRNLGGKEENSGE